MNRKTTETDQNPYLDNRRQYSSVLESAAANAKGWRIISFVAMAIASLSVSGIVYIGGKSKFIPVVIEIDGYGTPMRLYTVSEETDTNDKRVTKAAIARIITTIRSVSPDASYQKKSLNEIRYFFATGSAGFERIQEYITGETNPFKRAKNEIVNIAINNVIALTEKTWQVEWLETIRERTGKVKRKESYIATFTITQAEKITPKMLYINPTGIIVENLDWNIRINN